MNRLSPGTAVPAVAHFLRSASAFGALSLLSLLAPPETLAFNQYVVEVITPRGAQKGTTVNALFYGNYLEHPQEVVSNRGGIRAVSFEAPQPSTETFGNVTPPSSNPQSLRATLEVAPDCPPGMHLLFLRTDRFLSEPVLFYVGEMPGVNELETAIGGNDEPPRAQSVPINSTIHGRIHASSQEADRDCYAIEARKGDRLSFDLQGVRVATTHYWGENDCRLRLLAPDGRVLAQCDDTAQYVQDPFLSVEVPQDGRYVLEVSQHPGAVFTRFAHYLLHVGSFPRPEAVYPAGGRPGEKLAVQLLSNGRGALRQTVELPQDGPSPSPITFFEFRPEDTGGRSPTGLPMRVTSHPNLLESEPNDVAENAQPFTLPVALNGIVGNDGDEDVWRFHAEKGEAIDIRVFARSLGTPLDPKIWIRPARAQQEGDRALLDTDDSTMQERGYFSHTIQAKDTLDPAVTFVAKESGDYLLGIEDTRGLGGRSSVYRIEVQSHRDSFYVYPGRPSRPASYDWTTREAVLQVPRGGRWTATMKLDEGLGTQFSAESFVIEAVGLPPGVTMEAPLITPATMGKEVPVQFTAAPGAKPGIHFIELLARPVNAERRADAFCQRGFVFSNRRAGLGWMPVWIERFPLAVVEEPPFRLELERPALGLVQAGELDLHVKIHRQADWNQPVQIKLDYLPPGVVQGVPVDAAPEQTSVKVPLKATADAPLHTWKICVNGTSLEGNSLLGSGCRLSSSALVDLPVTQPFVTLEFDRASVRRGDSGVITATLKHLKPFTGAARASLVGLPVGVKLLEPFPEIRARDKTCTFRIEANGDALLGQYKQIQAEIAFQEGDQRVRQQTGSGVLRVDPALTAVPAN
jgi:hypothetical protein